jgi:glycosyltransferase involved in cell wall biosynthesis
MHSERGYYDRGKSLLNLESVNLIDFFLVVFGEVESAVLMIPVSGTRGDVALGLGKNTRVINIAYPDVSERKIKKWLSTIKFIRQLTSGKVIREIKDADYSVSVGLSFSGIVFGLVRTFVANKKHSFIVRGNRLKTTQLSSKPFLNKNLTLARILLYRRLMVYLLNSGKAEIWSQGQEGYEYYRRRCSNYAKKRISLLNAVLRELAKEDEDSDHGKKYDLVFAGRITKEKGVFDLIKAVSAIAEKGLKVTVAFIGEGHDKAQAIELAQDLGVSDQINFLGYVSSSERLASLIKEGRLFVLPSHTEGLPRAMLESMSLGVPVLVTPVGGIKHVIQDRKNGFLVEPGSPLKLAQKITEILELTDKDKTYRLIEKARSDSRQYEFHSRAKYFLEHSLSQPSMEIGG